MIMAMFVSIRFSNKDSKSSKVQVCKIPIFTIRSRPVFALISRALKKTTDNDVDRKHQNLIFIFFRVLRKRSTDRRPNGQPNDSHSFKIIRYVFNGKCVSMRRSEKAPISLNLHISCCSPYNTTNK